MPAERSILLAKRPLLGRVKTRLVPPLEPREALALHGAMLLDSIALLRQNRADGREVEVRFDGPLEPDAELAAALAGLRLAEQGPGNLGERLRRAFDESHAESVEATVVIGADSPTLPGERIEAAFARLAAGCDAVMAPAADGGYVLLGLRRPCPGLFRDVPWGSPDVAAATRARAAAAGIEIAELAPWYDVDDAAGLARLQAAFRESPDPAFAPATRRWLERLSRRGDGLDGARNIVL